MKNRTDGHVLIVEDDLSTKTLYQYTLMDFVENTIVSSVSEAKQVLAERDISIALIDLALANEEDGLSLIRFMKADPDLSGIPAIAVTAHAFPVDRQNAVEAGCDEFVTKPLGGDDLKGLLERYLHISGSQDD